MLRRLCVFLVSALLTVSIACTSPAERQARHFARAEAASAAGDLPRALTELEAAAGYDPRDREAVARLAETLLAAGRPREAREAILRLPTDVPRDAAFLELQVRVLLRCSRDGEALPILLALGARDDLDAVARERLLGELLQIRWELPEEALALAANGETPNALLVRRRYHAARREWGAVAYLEERFLTAYPAHVARGEIALAVARRELRAGHPERTERLAEEVAASEPRSVEPLVLRGLALLQRGRVEEGREALRLALALEPTNEAAREALAGRSPTPDRLTIDVNVDRADRKNR